MKDEFSRRGIRLIALSKDTVEQAAHHKVRDQLSFTLLADPGLTVIRQYGLEHHKAIEFSKGGFTVGGMPLALVPQFQTMAIPTTLLIDETATVVWVDQADDYRLRSSEVRVLAAADQVFGPPSASAPR